jgi:hypothetical protein
MRLRLQYPPIPEYAAKHAQLAVEAARNVDAIDLDYSPKSLAQIDHIITRFHNEGLQPDQIGETVFTFGCYVGEVFVQHHGGIWKMSDDTNLPKELKDKNLMVIEMPNGDVWNPIGKTFKLLENGEVDSVVYFYYIAIKEEEK